MLDYANFNHDKYARSRPRDDFWGQIKRTVKGQPASEAQIKLITDAIKDGLEMKDNDHLMDLCCGNGALSSKLCDEISELMGIDNSEYLISVAKEFFEDPPKIKFEHSDIIAFMNEMMDLKARTFTKCLCYGSFSYLECNIIEHIFEMLESKYKNISHFFIGNIPNLAKANEFFIETIPTNLDLSSSKSAIGKWWSEAEIRDIATRNGWDLEISIMPNNFYAAKYRFDAILTRKIKS